MSSTAPPDQAASKSNQFTTFGGVFTPSILTILGVIMFMRTGYVTGQAGILMAVAVLVISKLITFLTGLSISAVSTNTKVEGGGAYFPISRALGPEFGGSIGLALFLAQALSVPVDAVHDDRRAVVRGQRRRRRRAERGRRRAHGVLPVHIRHDEHGRVRRVLIRRG